MALLSQGLVLLVAGISIVFLFLLLLVLVMVSSSRLVKAFDHILPDPTERKKSRSTGDSSKEAGVLLAIAIAAAKARSN